MNDTDLVKFALDRLNRMSNEELMAAIIKYQHDTDIKFLKEIKDLVIKGVHDKDYTKIEYALNMIDDWISELGDSDE